MRESALSTRSNLITDLSSRCRGAFVFAAGSAAVTRGPALVAGAGAEGIFGDLPSAVE